MKYLYASSLAPLCLLLCLLAACVCPPAHAAPADSILRSRVQFELKPSTPDDELIAIAEAADINIVADATDLPTKASLVETPWTGRLPWSLQVLISEITNARMMTWHSLPDNKTLLFWSQPSMATLRAALQQADLVTAVAPRLDDLTIRQRLTAYLRDTHGWDATNPNFSVSVPISRLPEDVKREVIAAAQKSPPVLPTGLLRAMATDDGWRSARLKMVMPKRRNRYVVQVQHPQLVLSFSQGGPFVDYVLAELKPRQ